jgi:hypothetical protein
MNRGGAPEHWPADPPDPKAVHWHIFALDASCAPWEGRLMLCAQDLERAVAHVHCMSDSAPEALTGVVFWRVGGLWDACLAADEHLTHPLTWSEVLP